MTKSIEEIKKELNLSAPLEKEAALQKKAFYNPIAQEIDSYLGTQTLSQFCEQIEKEAGIQVPATTRQFIAQAEANGASEEEIINFLKEKYSA